MLRAHAWQIRTGKWLSTMHTRMPSNTAPLLVSYFYADDIIGVAYLKKKKHTTDGDSSSQVSTHPKKDVK